MLFEGCILFPSAFELGILVVFDENQTQRVYQRADSTQPEVNRMTCKQDEGHHHDAEDDIHAVGHRNRQRIEDAAKD